jgi:hypothetical protein
VYQIVKLSIKVAAILDVISAARLHINQYHAGRSWVAVKFLAFAISYNNKIIGDIVPVLE